MLYDRPIQDSFDVHFDPTHEAASSTRRQARSVLDAAGVPGEAAADLELVIAELACNAVEQAPEAPIRLEMTILDQVVVVTLTNRANGEDRPGSPSGSDDGAPDAMADRGWGLGIVDHLSDQVEIEADGGWTSVRAIRHY